MERNRNAYNDNGFVKMKYKLVLKKRHINKRIPKEHSDWPLFV